MPETLNSGLSASLEEMRKAGTHKSFHFISSPMDTQVEMEQCGNVLVLSSNNYLGLANHPDVISAGKEALDRHGAGTASVRFICGTFSIHREIEQALAKLHRCEGALTYVSCWAANTGAIPALFGKDDALISDELNHASLIDGCRLTKSKRLIYRHSNMDDLQERLKEAQSCRRILVLTDGVFSMEGDIADLPAILELSRRYNASVLVDDSHGVGVLGKHGRGTAEHWGVEGEVDIVTGTLGKALGGGAGGYVAASSTVVEYLEQVSRPQIFSNALPATVAGSALKAIQILEGEPERVDRLHELVDRVRDGLKQKGFKPLEGPSAIVPILLGETSFAIKMSQELLREGIFVTGFGFPVVPEGKARVRLQVCASLTDEQVAKALETFERVGKRLGVI